MHRHRIVVAAGALALGSLAVPRAARALTLEQALSAPWSSQLVAARAAPRIAWVTEARGLGNVFVADAPGFEPRQLTRYAADDGLSVHDLAISADGKTVVFSHRAGGPNDSGEIANPTADVSERPRHEVVAIDVATGRARALSDDLVTSSVAISPDGKWAAWTQKDLVIVSLSEPAAPNKAADKSVDKSPDKSGDKPAMPKPRRIPAVHGSTGRARWSPDSKALAYEVRRGDHGFIAVYRLGDDQVRYLAPAMDNDILPRWSADGRSVAFIRGVNQPRGAPAIPLELAPFSLWVADVASGRAHRVFDAGAALTDGYPDMTAEKSFVYAGDHLVFSWEHDGRNHIYSVPAGATDGKPRLLTPGELDTDDVTLSPDGKTLIYSSNQGDLDRRHLWRVRVDGGGPPEAVTRGDSIEWAPVVTADGRLVCISSSATTPGVPTEIAGAKRRPLVALAGDFPAAELVTPAAVIIKADDGTEAHAQVFRARGGAANKPALVFLHGGPVRQMMLGFHDLRYYHYTYAMNQFLAAHGYVVLSLNYRGGIMYGRAFREAQTLGWRGNAEMAEIRAAGKYLAALPGVDPKRLGVFGASNGGYLTVMALARDPQLWATGVDVMGVHDWSTFFERDAAWAAASDHAAAQKLAVDSSPVGQLATLKGPLLVIASDDDRNVPVSQAVDFILKLRAARVPFEQLMIPDEEHFLDRWHTWLTIERATVEYLDRKLGSATR